MNAEKKDSSAPSVDDLVKYLHHYHYEINMLSASYQAHNMYKAQQTFGNTPLIWALANASLESFLIHSRCLIEFFFVDEWPKDSYKNSTGEFDLNKVKTDYAAQHYIPSWIEIRKKTVSRIVPYERFKEISKQLGHFSRERKEQHSWPHFEMFPDIIKLHEEFVKNLPEPYPKRWKELCSPNG